MQGLRLGGGACSTGLFQCRGDGGQGAAKLGCKALVSLPRRRSVALQSARGVCRDKARRVVAAASASSTLQQAPVEEKDEVALSVNSFFWSFFYLAAMYHENLIL